MKVSLLIILSFIVTGHALASTGAVPLTYIRIAQKYELNPVDLYQQAINKTGYQSEYVATKMPWPFSLMICEKQHCQTHQPANRQALFEQASIALTSNKTIFIGPMLMAWAQHKETLGNHLWLATDPVVSLNLAAKSLATGTVTPSSPEPAIQRVSQKLSQTATSLPNKKSLQITQINQLVDELSQDYNLDPDLVKAIIKNESNYNAQAVSPAGAIGLMQLMPATGRAFGVPSHKRTDPVLNIKGGMAYLKELKKVYNGDVVLMLAAYNAGETAVAKHGGTIPPYPETMQYIFRVLNTYLRNLGKAA